MKPDVVTLLSCCSQKCPAFDSNIVQVGLGVTTSGPAYCRRSGKGLEYSKVPKTFPDHCDLPSTQNGKRVYTATTPKPSILK